MGRTAALALLLTAVACSSADDAVTTTTLGVTSSTTAPADEPTLTSTAPETESTATPTTLVDPVSALQGALDTLAAGYHFTATVTVREAVTLVADGDRIGDASRLTLSSDGATVDYVVTAEGSYARPEGGEWELLDVPPATTDPIGALRAPSAVSSLPTTDGAGVHLLVTVSATALGIPTEGDVEVEVTVVEGVVSEITYRTPVEGGTATVTTAIGPLADPTPISAPL